MTFEPDTLSFTASDYATAQTVIVTNTNLASTDITITLSKSSTDPAYNELTQVAFEDPFPFITYALHVHNAQTPEPEDSTRMIQVWFTLHPTDSGLPTAASDITIRYDVTGGTTTGDATAGTDYTAPSANTVTISPTDTSASEGESVVLADDSATVAIGDPNENAIYFFPNYPLVDGDAAFFECYIVPPSGQSFTGSGVLISFDGFDSASSGATINGNSTLNGVDLSQYTGAVSVFLQHSNDRPSSRLSLVYNESRDAPTSSIPNRFSCHGSIDVSTSAALINGSFGTVEFGQSYE